MPKIHPTAIVDPQAVIAADVEIGAYCIVEGDVEIGPACVLREHVVIRRFTSLGKGNFVDSNAVLGGWPQDLAWDSGMVSYLRIGADNVFREGVTISRASKSGEATIVGNRTYWMGYAHAGHDATIEDDVILVNGVLLGGHSTVGKRAFLSGHVLVHQFTWVGEGVMTQGHSGISMHVPPFCVLSGINHLHGLNVVGLRRNPEITAADRAQIKEAHRLVYRSGLSPSKALEQMDQCTDWNGPARRFRDFIRQVINAPKPFNRGLCPFHMDRGRGSSRGG